MRRGRPLRPEVAGGGDDPPAEVPLPEPIHDHAGRQRVRRGHEPVRQRRAPPRAARLRRDRRRVGPLRREHRRHSGLDGRPAIRELAPTEEIRGRGRGPRLIQSDRLGAWLGRACAARSISASTPLRVFAADGEQGVLERRFPGPPVLRLGVEDQRRLARGPLGRRALEGDDHVIGHPGRRPEPVADGAPRSRGLPIGAGSTRIPTPDDAARSRDVPRAGRSGSRRGTARA